MAKKGSTKSSKKNDTVTTTTEVTVIPEQDKSLEASESEIILTEQQALFLDYYYDPGSPTWYNAKQSAIRAGFGENYACQITYRQPDWWLDMVRRQPFIKKIEKHFDEVLNLPNTKHAIGLTGLLYRTEVYTEETNEVYKTGKRAGQKKTRKVKMKVPIIVADIAVIKAKNEVAKLAAPAHDPDRYGKKATNNNKFVFNMAPVREKYKT